MKKHVVTKEFSWDMAHMLAGHAGLCQNIHGHTYKLKVSIIAPRLVDVGSSKGMVVDFKDLKEVVKNEIVDKFDHAFVADETAGEEMMIAEYLAHKGKKVTVLPIRTTAENMSKWIYDTLKETLISGYAYPEEIDLKIELWETPTSCATYGGDV